MSILSFVRKQVFKKLPLETKENIAREKVRLPTPESFAHFEFKVADTLEELEQAFELLYECYIEAGFLQENHKKIYVLPHHLLSTTTTLVAKSGSQVVGTLSIIKKGALDLPSEKLFEVNHSPFLPSETAEISSLAVKKDFRRAQGGAIFFPLLKLMYDYCVQYFGIKQIYAVIHPKDTFFYKGLLSFEEMNQPIIDYMGAPAKVLKLQIFRVPEFLKSLYENKPQHKNLYDFFCLKKYTEIKLPKRARHINHDPILTEEIFEKLFIERAELFHHMKFQDYFKIKSNYQNTTLESLFEKLEATCVSARKHFRFAVTCEALVYEQDSIQPLKFMIKDLSRGGFSGYFMAQYKNLNLDNLAELEGYYPAINPGTSLRFDLTFDGFKVKGKAEVSWRKENRIGLKLISAVGDWAPLLDMLDRQMSRSTTKHSEASEAESTAISASGIKNKISSGS